MVCEARKQSIARMETDYSKHTHFRWKIKWRLEHLSALGIMVEGPFKVYIVFTPLLTPQRNSQSLHCTDTFHLITIKRQRFTLFVYFLCTSFLLIWRDLHVNTSSYVRHYSSQDKLFWRTGFVVPAACGITKKSAQIKGKHSFLG